MLCNRKRYLSDSNNGGSPRKRRKEHVQLILVRKVKASVSCESFIGNSEYLSLWCLPLELVIEVVLIAFPVF